MTAPFSVPKTGSGACKVFHDWEPSRPPSVFFQHLWLLKVDNSKSRLVLGVPPKASLGSMCPLIFGIARVGQDVLRQIQGSEAATDWMEEGDVTLAGYHLIF